ncbi:Translation initiation factor 5A [Candidatus Norongarragalina meridionalis]|nr:Translation initiation factor 5A [Candidatus Norongarragalina meridionalis]
MNELKVGKYVIIDEVPCRVVSMDKSKPGKHGAAKMRVEAIGLFDNVKRSLMKSTDADVEVPIVIRKRAQVVSVAGTTAQLMDLVSFETFEVEVPEEMLPEVESGREIQYMEVLGARLLLRVAGE